MPEDFDINYFSNSFIGPRKKNEDFQNTEFWKESFIATVADGVGGRNCGAMASEISVKTFHEYIKLQPNLELESVIEIVNNVILEYSSRNIECEGMASTFTSCIIQRNVLKGIHVGDSRLYILRRNGIMQLTIDHTEAFNLLNDGLISKEQYINYPRKNVIDSALGMGKEIKKQLFEFQLESKDRIILSTDGFYNLFSKVELRDFSLINSTFSEFINKIQLEVSLRKLTDNATFTLIEFSS
jgi:serine/threonine protein phosphatase PrpC